MSPQERFNKYCIDDSVSDCKIWCSGNKRYGSFWLNGRPVAATRAAYELFIGPIPTGLFVLHYCDNDRCVNPNHLFLGTQLDNIKDRDKKQRNARGETHARARLTENDVKNIRRLARLGSTQRELAKLYDTPASNICNIINRKRWSHV